MAFSGHVRVFARGGHGLRGISRDGMRPLCGRRARPKAHPVTPDGLDLEGSSHRNPLRFYNVYGQRGANPGA